MKPREEPDMTRTVEELKGGLVSGQLEGDAAQTVSPEHLMTTSTHGLKIPARAQESPSLSDVYPTLEKREAAQGPGETGCGGIVGNSEASTAVLTAGCPASGQTRERQKPRLR